MTAGGLHGTLSASENVRNRSKIIIIKKVYV